MGFSASISAFLTIRPFNGRNITVFNNRQSFVDLSLLKKRPPVALGFTLGVVHYGSKQMYYDLHSPLSESLRKELRYSEIIQCSPYSYLLHLPHYYLSFHYLQCPNISSRGCSYNIITYNM